MSSVDQAVAAKFFTELLGDARTSLARYQGLKAAAEGAAGQAVTARDESVGALSVIRAIVSAIGIPHEWDGTRLRIRTGPDTFGPWVDLQGPKGDPGDDALVSFGATTGTAAEGNDARIVGASQKSANLSDLTDRAAARSALALASVAASGSYTDLVNRPTLGTAAALNGGTAAGNVPILDSNSKILASLLPALAITDSFEVASQAAMLALTAERGDIAIRTDLNKTFVLSAEPATTLANWKELRTPTDVVLSVAGLAGTITAAQLQAALGLAAVALSGSASDLGSGTLPDARLANTGTAGTYGTSTQVPRISTDSKGRITGVSLVDIAGGGGGGGGAADGAGGLPTIWTPDVGNRPSWATVSNQTALLALNTLRLVPFDIKRAGTATRIGLEVATAANAGNLVRIGIYSPGVNGLPGALLLDAGTVAADTVGFKEIVISQALSIGFYWIAFLSDGSPVLRGVNSASGIQFINASGTAGTGLSRPLTFGPLPTDESASGLTIGLAAVPIPTLRAA